MKKWFFLILISAGGFAFSILNEEKPVPIPPSAQRDGDVAKGFEYLTTGDYIKSGIPYDFFFLGFPKDTNNYLQRKGPNAVLSHEYTAVKAFNGEMVVAPNCLQCHAQVFDNKLYVGMGNTFIDFSVAGKMNPQQMDLVEKMLIRSSPSKYAAARYFLNAAKTIGPLISTQVRGVNAADRLAAVLVAHRDPTTLRWKADAQMPIPDEVIPSDVPAWWLLKKKNGMFYNGFGRGDFGRFLMASNLLTVKDTSESREVDAHFNDVLAYIRSIEPPKYPKPINKALASKGGVVYTLNCSKCHGKYGSDGEYPNLLVPENIIRTDSALYKANYQNPQFVNWFNNSWFATGDHPARLEPFNGYIAPPLDGVWVTAPYLHNGSVPTIEAVLNSKLRPEYWQRDFVKPKYDYEKLGWKFETKNAPGGTTVYNTHINGYGNYGHTFGDKLNEQDRKAVIEYLKTL